jgi:hypothetical protein
MRFDVGILLQSRPLPSRHAQVAGSRSVIQPHAIVCVEEKTQEVDGGDIQLQLTSSFDV